MDKLHSPYRYTTDFAVNRNVGSTSLKLIRSGAKGVHTAAEIVFWDAVGQFNISAFEELPIEVLELFVAEAKDRIRVS